MPGPTQQDCNHALEIVLQRTTLKIQAAIQKLCAIRTAPFSASWSSN